MACFYPMRAWQLDNGEIVFAERGKVRRELTLPCGQCIGCRLEQSRQWAIRCVHESQLYEHSVFVTLTYDDDHVPHDFSLDYADFQLFMRRLRRVKPGVRFYMCGEYGEDFGRPHFHAALFNCFFDDREVYRKLPSGSVLYTSKQLSELWPKGFVSVGDLTFESAAYIARYVMKKVTGAAAEKHYEAVDGYTGEVYQRKPEFTQMSRKPGIGSLWFKKFASDVYPRDFVVIRGVKMRPPRYYDKLLESCGAQFPDADDVAGPYCLLGEVDYRSDLVDDARVAEYSKIASDCTGERLAVREEVTKARLNLKKRGLQ